MIVQVGGVCWDLMSNIEVSQRPVGDRTCGFVRVKAREEIFHHSKSDDLLLSVRFFPEPFEELKTTLIRDPYLGG